MKKIQVFIVFSLIIVCLPLNLLSQEAPPDSFNGKHPRKGAYDRQEDKSKQAMKAIMIKKWLEKEMPELLEQIQVISEQYPQAVKEFKKSLNSREKQRLFRHKGGKMDKDIKVLAEGYLKAELESYVLAQKYKESTDENEQQKIKDDLLNILNKSFEIKEKLQTKVIEKMEQRIQKLKDMLKKRKGLKQQIVSERIETITDNRDLTKW